jgi:hypothetical protein
MLKNLSNIHFEIETEVNYKIKFNDLIDIN